MGEGVGDPGMPDGTPVRLGGGRKLQRRGWGGGVELEEGVQLAYDWFRENVKDARL